MNYIRTEYSKQLDRALVCRKKREWKLYPIEEWDKFDLNDEDEYFDSLPSESRPLKFNFSSEFHVETNLEYFTEVIKEIFPALFELFETFSGKVALAGGFFSLPYNGNDADLFFYNCSKEEAKNIMIAFGYMVKKYHKKKEAVLRVSRSDNITNFSYESRYGVKSYQFIHRIYPSLGHILGGFDLSASMIAFDGVNIYATEQGAWAFTYKCIVVDISRRSLSFANRLVKYNHRGYSIVFPGVNQADIEKRVFEVKINMDNFFLALQNLEEEFGVYVGGSYLVSDDIDYHHRVTLDTENVKKAKDITKDSYKLNPYLYLKGFRVVSSKYNKDVLLLKKPLQTDDKNANSEDYLPGEESVSTTYMKNKEYLIERNFKAYMEDDPKSISCEAVLGEIERVEDFFREAPITFLSAEEQNFKMIMKLIRNNYRSSKSILKLHDPKAELANALAFFQNRSKELSEMTWIEQDPQRQWSGTVNPAILKADEFYFGRWNGLTTIIQPEVEMLLRLARKQKENVWNKVPKEIFDKIIAMIPYL